MNNELMGMLSGGGGDVGIIGIHFGWANAFGVAKYGCDYYNIYINDILVCNVVTDIPSSPGRFAICNDANKYMTNFLEGATDCTLIETPIKPGDKFTLKFKENYQSYFKFDTCYLSCNVGGGSYVPFSNTTYNGNSVSGCSYSDSLYPIAYSENIMQGYIPTGLTKDSNGIYFIAWIFNEQVDTDEPE